MASTQKPTSFNSKSVVENNENEDNLSKNERLKLKTTEVTIQAGSAQEIPVSVFPGCSVEWNFQTEGGDIAFTAIMENEKGEATVLQEEARYNSQEETCHGKIMLEKEGTLWLRWDNTYSWFTNKKLVYSVVRDIGNTEKSHASPCAPVEDGTAPANTEEKVDVPITEKPLSSGNGEEINNDVLVASKPNKVASAIPVRIILGTMTMGGQVSPGSSKKMLQSFLKAPCVQNHLTAGKAELDTARMYQHGKTEAVLGDIMNGDLKEKVYIATKVNPFKGYDETLRPESIVRQVEASLEAMRIESVDLLYLHAPDHSTSIEITLEACHKLFLAGKFRELGLSNYTAWETVHIHHLCKQRGWVQPSVYQGMYNALTRQVEKELFPALRKLNIRFYAYNPLAGGLLTGRHKDINKKPMDGRFGSKAFSRLYVF
mmetsp:Transcript_3667/g.4897  ORF Transcript_3667/g.4897 Transcript_3667/m.4897 type:complete len:429 (+) Transcript_3667:119-1405(+)|eukprot:CAMPEP_0184010930 /NCGR_PEP_ID=MMETSP0954-20121128/3522_1 /TAXON_ID=627963 /ORGANISM="Aplanochytrium sp, Strain PBS07" /LENGTH=428 /DNA_ID=CAMNT_0026290645 /DNA_START=40 /DNA_END=1326 /DNA_ORIENTATION=-